MTPDPSDEARIPGLVQAYLDADYRWSRDGAWEALHVGRRAESLEAAFPDAEGFGLLSAWNPHSVERPDDSNRAADALLHAALRESGAGVVPGFSAARNRTWREPSWVTVGLPVDTLDALARRFGQLATLHAARGEPMRLRVYADRPASAPADAAVMWLGRSP